MLFDIPSSLKSKDSILGPFIFGKGKFIDLTLYRMITTYPAVNTQALSITSELYSHEREIKKYTIQTGIVEFLQIALFTDLIASFIITAHICFTAVIKMCTSME